MTRLTARAMTMGRERSITVGRRNRQLILDYVGSHISEHGWPPTVREIGDAVGVYSPSTVHAHLRQLHRDGKLVLGGGPRMIRLTSGSIHLR